MRKAIVIARGTEFTNSTNGFVLGKPYPAEREGFGWNVSLGNGVYRFVTEDGSGGAHLQYRGRVEITTEGYFEIEEIKE